MVDFYTMYGLEDKLDGVDAALDKFKGKENKIMPKLYKKYKDNVDAYYAKLDEEERGAAALAHKTPRACRPSIARATPCTIARPAARR